MFHAQVLKVGDDFAVTIPDDEASRLNIQDGDIVGITILPVEVDALLRREVDAAFQESWERNSTGYRYLNDR